MLTTEQKREAYHLCREIQSVLVARLEKIDGTAKAESHCWQKDTGTGGGESPRHPWGCNREGGGELFTGGREIVIRDLEEKNADKPYYATGISTICHMANPHAPIGHMNIRLLEVGDTFLGWWWG